MARAPRRVSPLQGKQFNADYQHRLTGRRLRVTLDGTTGVVSVEAPDGQPITEDMQEFVRQLTVMAEDFWENHR